MSAFEDCSDHAAGYDWAEENTLRLPTDCPAGYSMSFQQGCQTYVDYPYRGKAWRALTAQAMAFGHSLKSFSRAAAASKGGGVVGMKESAVFARSSEMP